MTSIITKASVLAIMTETTEGTPVSPTAAGDFLALQDDATMKPSFAVLDNAEFKNSIGKSKPILGAESPTFDMSHYLRASGVEGTAPGFNLMLKGAFGTESVRSTERSTTSASTTTVLKLAANGSEFTKGDMLLIKDTTNGYSIRAVESVATNDLTIGFQVETAPATGMALGKGVTYKPASSAHPALSVWHYLGNSGAVQMMSGGKVTSFEFDATAGELVNAKYTIEGLEYYFNPIEITASNNYIDYNDGGVKAASIAVGMYKDPGKLAQAIEDAMDALSTPDMTVTYSSTTGKFTFTQASGTFSLLFNTGTNVANSIAPTLGFAATDLSAALTYTNTTAKSWAAGYTPTYDSADPLAAKDNEVMLGTQTDYACFHASKVSFSLKNTNSAPGDICAVSGKGASIFSERAVEITVSALLSQYEQANFQRFAENTEVRFQYSFGAKSGTNWIAGKAGALYVSSATITEFSIDNADGLAQLTLKLSAFINSTGENECYLGFV